MVRKIVGRRTNLNHSFRNLIEVFDNFICLPELCCRTRAPNRRNNRLAALLDVLQPSVKRRQNSPRNPTPAPLMIR